MALGNPLSSISSRDLEEPDSGKVNIGETVIFGNYSQGGLLIKEDMRVIEFVKNIAESFPLASGGSLSAAQFLQLFLFPPEQQYTYISSLSGGEKRRLALAEHPLPQSKLPDTG